MGGLFSSKKKPSTQSRQITEQDKAILSLKQQRDKLKQYQKRINNNLEKERNVAKDLLHNGKREKAKLLLKKKHYQENLLKKTDDQLESIDRLIQDVEFAQVEIKIVEGLKQGNEALKKIHELMSIEDVEKIMDETKESVEYQNEIDLLISGALTDEDEEDIMKELEELNKEIDLPSVPEHDIIAEDNLPDVPIQEPVSKKKITEREKEAVAAS